MLRENQQARPNVYQVLREACAMQGREPPVKDVSVQSINHWLVRLLTFPLL
jgi:AP2-associated kinase